MSKNTLIFFYITFFSIFCKSIPINLKIDGSLINIKFMEIDFTYVKTEDDLRKQILNFLEKKENLEHLEITNSKYCKNKDQILDSIKKYLDNYFFFYIEVDCKKTYFNKDFKEAFKDLGNICRTDEKVYVDLVICEKKKFNVILPDFDELISKEDISNLINKIIEGGRCYVENGKILKFKNDYIKQLKSEINAFCDFFNSEKSFMFCAVDSCLDLQNCVYENTFKYNFFDARLLSIEPILGFLYDFTYKGNDVKIGFNPMILKKYDYKVMLVDPDGVILNIDDEIVIKQPKDVLYKSLDNKYEPDIDVHAHFYNKKFESKNGTIYKIGNVKSESCQNGQITIFLSGKDFEKKIVNFNHNGVRKKLVICCKDLTPYKVLFELDIIDKSLSFEEISHLVPEFKETSNGEFNLIVDYDQYYKDMMKKLNNVRKVYYPNCCDNYCQCCMCC